MKYWLTIRKRISVNTIGKQNKWFAVIWIQLTISGKNVTIINNLGGITGINM